MRLNQVHWGYAVGGLLAVEVAMIAAAFAWVAIYSYLIEPGHPAAFYEAYAQTASPYVALTLSIPFFFLMGRWMAARLGPDGWPTVMVLFGFYCLIEIPIMLVANDPVVNVWFTLVSLPTKFAALHWGARMAVRANA